jgi:hypothetical protein
MTATCFPYGFPTGQSQPPRGMDRPWPRCAHAMTSNSRHECGAIAKSIGTTAEGVQTCFCASCREYMSVAKDITELRALPPLAGQGGDATDPLTIRAYIVRLPGEAGADWAIKTWASSAEQAIMQVCNWQGIPTRFARGVSQSVE